MSTGEEQVRNETCNLKKNAASHSHLRIVARIVQAFSQSEVFSKVSPQKYCVSNYDKGSFKYQANAMGNFKDILGFLRIIAYIISVVQPLVCLLPKSQS